MGWNGLIIPLVLLLFTGTVLYLIDFEQVVRAQRFLILSHSFPPSRARFPTTHTFLLFSYEPLPPAVRELANLPSRREEKEKFEGPTKTAFVCARVQEVERRSNYLLPFPICNNTDSSGEKERNKGTRKGGLLIMPTTHSIIVINGTPRFA